MRLARRPYKLFRGANEVSIQKDFSASLVGRTRLTHKKAKGSRPESSACRIRFSNTGDAGITRTMESEFSLREFYNGKSSQELLNGFRAVLREEYSDEQRAPVERCLEGLGALVFAYGYLAGVALMKAHLEFLVRVEAELDPDHDRAATRCTRSAADVQRTYGEAVDEEYGVEQHIRIDECSERIRRVLDRYPEAANLALVLVHFEYLAATEADTMRGERVLAS